MVPSGQQQPESARMTDEECVAYIEGLRAGDPEVLQRFVRTYRPVLERLANRQLDAALRRRVSPETIAQSVCRTFLRRASEQQFDIPSERALVGLLTAIALKKVRTHVRFHRRAKRSVDRDVVLDQAQCVEAPQSATFPAAAFERFLASTIERFESKDRQILALRMRDMEQTEIAVTLGCSERTVRRKLATMQAQLRDELLDA